MPLFAPGRKFAVATQFYVTWSVKRGGGVIDVIIARALTQVSGTGSLRLYLLL